MVHAEHIVEDKWLAYLDRRRNEGPLARLHGLNATVQIVLEQNPFSGQVFVFRGRRGDLIKLFWRDGHGLWSFAKQLECGRLIWPHVAR